MLNAEAQHIFYEYEYEKQCGIRLFRGFFTLLSQITLFLYLRPRFFPIDLNNIVIAIDGPSG